jgi:PAS domain S-box-containing protein
LKLAANNNDMTTNALSIAITTSHRQPADRFFAQSPDLMCVVGYDGCFRRVNPAWTNLLGWNEAELVGQPALNIVHPDDHERLKEARAVVRAGGHPDRIEIRYIHKNGSHRWIWWNVFPQPEEQIIYAIGRDITEQKKEEDFYDGLAEVSTQDGIEGQLVDAERFGLTRTEMKVTTLIMRGCSAKETATSLGISYNTIKVHLRNIFEKVGVRNQRALISLMFSNQNSHH